MDTMQTKKFKRISSSDSTVPILLDCQMLTVDDILTKCIPSSPARPPVPTNEKVTMSQRFQMVVTREFNSPSVIKNL